MSGIGPIRKQIFLKPKDEVSRRDVFFCEMASETDNVRLLFGNNSHLMTADIKTFTEWKYGL